MSLPSNVVERLFDRLVGTYGRDWTSKWEGVNPAAVKTVWAHELAAYGSNLKAIAWALENLPGKCPNVIEFKQLCRQAPANDALLLNSPKAPAEVVDKELARMAAKAFTLPKDESGNVDHILWIKKLEDRQRKGEKLNMAQIQAIKKAKIELGWTKQ